MIYITYVIAGIFVALSFAMLYVYYRSTHTGMLAMGLTYACAGALAILLGEWWPLAAGFALAWVFKLLGFEPRTGPPAGEAGAAGIGDKQDESRT